MNKLDDEIRKALADSESPDDLDREEGIFRQMAGLYHGRLWWMGVFTTLEAVACVALIVLAAIRFFQAEEAKMADFLRNKRRPPGDHAPAGEVMGRDADAPQ